MWWKCDDHHVHHSLPNLYKCCAPNNVSQHERNSRYTQLHPNIVAAKKDEEEKLEAPPSVSLLLDKIGGAGPPSFFSFHHG
eukprot:12769144-Ditylum_brightwellii.AAC.1